MIKREVGQSMIEVIFSLGVVILLLSGAAFLATNVLGAKTKVYERKRAIELARIVVEDQVERLDSETDFWKLTSIVGATRTGFEGYKYNIGFTGMPELCGGKNCARMVVEVFWGVGETKIAAFEKFITDQK